MEDGVSKGLFRQMLLLSAHILEKPRYGFLLAFSESSREILAVLRGNCICSCHSTGNGFYEPELLFECDETWVWEE